MNFRQSPYIIKSWLTKWRPDHLSHLLQCCSSFEVKVLLQQGRSIVVFLSHNSDLFILVRNKHAQLLFPLFLLRWCVCVGGGGNSLGVFTSSVSAYWIFKFQSDAHNNTHLTSCDWHFWKVFVFIKTNTYAVTQTDKNKTASESNADRLTWQVKLKKGYVMLCKKKTTIIHRNIFFESISHTMTVWCDHRCQTVKCPKAP